MGLRYAAVATRLGSNLVIAGGESASGPVSTVYLFDTASRAQVTGIGHLPTAARARVGLRRSTGTGLVAGGLNAAGRPLRSVYVIDPAGVRPMTPLARPVSDAAATQAGQVGWILGGLAGAGGGRRCSGPR